MATTVYFLYAAEDAEAAELLIGAALRASPSLARASDPHSTAAAFVFVSDAFVASPECLRSARIINDVFAGRAVGKEVSRVVVLSLVPSFLRRSPTWSEIAFLFATATHVDLPYGLESLTQRRLDAIVMALNSAVKAEVAPAHCCTRESANFSLLCCAILLSVAAVTAGMAASTIIIGGTMMYEVTPTAVSNGFLAVDKSLTNNGYGNSNSESFSCSLSQEVSINRVLGADRSQQLAQTICTDLRRVVSSRCMYFAETTCSGNWQPWQLEAVADTYPFAANITHDLTAAFPNAVSMLSANYILMALSTVPMYLLAHSCWFGPFFGRFVPCCFLCVRFAARRPLAMWSGTFVLLLLAQLLAATAFLQTQGLAKSIATWESGFPNAQSGPFYFASYNWDARYTDPVTGGLIFINARSPLVESCNATLYGTVATLATWLFTLLVGSCCTFCNRRGASLSRSHLPPTWTSPSHQDIELMQPRQRDADTRTSSPITRKSDAVGGLQQVLTTVHLPVPIVGEIPIENPSLRVFLSHQWDAKIYLNDIITRLSERNVSYWLDVRDMSPGDEMFGKLSEGVGSVDVLVAVVTFAYLQSANCYKELDLAMKTSTPVVVIALQGRIWKESHTWLRSGVASAHPFSNFLERQCIVLDFTVGAPSMLPLSQRIVRFALPEPVLPDVMSDKEFELLARAINCANAMQVPREIGGKYRVEMAVFSVAVLHSPVATDSAAAEVLKGVLMGQGCTISTLETADVVFAVLTPNFLNNEVLVDDFVRRSTGVCSSKAQRIVMIIAEKAKKFDPRTEKQVVVDLPFLSHPRLGPLAAGQQYIPVETDLDAGTLELREKFDLGAKADKNKPDKLMKFWPNPFQAVSAAWKIQRSVVVSGPRTERPACVCMWSLLCCSHLCMTRQRSFGICASLSVFLTGLLFLIVVGFFGSGTDLVWVSTGDQIACPPSIVVVPSSLISSAASAAMASLVLSLCSFVSAIPLLQSLWLPRGVCGRFGAVYARASLACSTTFYWSATAATLLGVVVASANAHSQVSDLVMALHAKNYSDSSGTYHAYGNCVGSNVFVIVVIGSWALGSWIIAGCDARERFMCGGWLFRR